MNRATLSPTCRRCCISEKSNGALCSPRKTPCSQRAWHQQGCNSGYGIVTTIVFEAIPLVTTFSLYLALTDSEPAVQAMNL